MLCPANPAQVSETLNQLLTATDTTFGPCVEPRGSESYRAPDGSLRINPCRQILDDGLAVGSGERAAVVQEKMIEDFYNTNYVGSWIMVRGAPRLDKNGNLSSTKSACPPTLRSRPASIGPLRVGQIDSAKVPSNLIPLLADGGIAGRLATTVGDLAAGADTVGSFTRGPVQVLNLEVPEFEEGKPRSGPGGWWSVWSKARQDYRGFAPVHRGQCNVLVADGSVQSLDDKNGDGLLNNGFTTLSGAGFESDEVEVEDHLLFSKPALRGF
jgi:hypothetical protein